MSPLRLIVIAAACTLPTLALAQWQWIDKDGRKVFSDQPPPPGIPESSILKQPGKGSAAPAAPAAPVATAAPAAPKVTGKDKALEERKKAADAEAADKKKQEEDQRQAMRADNCQRAKKAKAMLDSGVRVATMNAKGEREFMEDAQRATETKRLEGVIARDCSPAPQ